jgi:hypothetical protein
VIIFVGYLGWQNGWWSLAGAAEGPVIDGGPLEGVVRFERVRSYREKLIFEVRPGKDFARFAEVAKGCSLRPGLFRAVLLRKGTPVGPAIVLDLRPLGEKAADLDPEETLSLHSFWDDRAAAFDGVLICH